VPDTVPTPLPLAIVQVAVIACEFVEQSAAFTFTHTSSYEAACACSSRGLSAWVLKVQGRGQQGSGQWSPRLRAGVNKVRTILNCMVKYRLLLLFYYYHLNYSSGVAVGSKQSL